MPFTDNERIRDLPRKQLAITFDTDLNLAPINVGDLPRPDEQGLVGLRILTDGNISLMYIDDTVAGPVFAVVAGDVIVARIKQVASVGTTVTEANMIGLA